MLLGEVSTCFSLGESLLFNDCYAWQGHRVPACQGGSEGKIGLIQAACRARATPTALSSLSYSSCRVPTLYPGSIHRSYRGLIEGFEMDGWISSCPETVLAGGRDRRWSNHRFWPQIRLSFLGIAWSGKNAEKPGSQPGVCPWPALNKASAFTGSSPAKQS